MVGNPDRVNADVFANPRHLAQIVPARGASIKLSLVVWQQEPNFERTAASDTRAHKRSPGTDSSDAPPAPRCIMPPK
jgi:hypothetical protein